MRAYLSAERSLRRARGSASATLTSHRGEGSFILGAALFDMLYRDGWLVLRGSSLLCRLVAFVAPGKGFISVSRELKLSVSSTRQHFFRFRAQHDVQVWHGPDHSRGCSFQRVGRIRVGMGDPFTDSLPIYRKNNACFGDVSGIRTLITSFPQESMLNSRIDSNPHYV